jgi:predicted RNase H-like HicB family nuclease
MADKTKSTHARAAGFHESTTGLSTSRSPLTVEIEQEDDGRWLAEVISMPGVMAYGASPEKAANAAKALTLRVIAERLEHGEAIPGAVDLWFARP